MEIKQLSKEYLERNTASFINILKEFKEEYWTEREFLIDLPQKWTCSLVATEGDSVIGYIIVSKKTSSYHIHKFMVHANHRNSGLGGQMLGHLLNKLMEDKLFAVSLKVYADNLKAVNFYLKHGFVKKKQDGALIEMEYINKKMVVAIHQPNFIPWAGFFHKLLLSDVFVFFDDVQFPRGKSFGSRALIKTSTGEQWLTVPVLSKGDFLNFNEISISNETNWSAKLLKTISFSYKKAPYFDLYYPSISNILDQKHSKLANLNIELITKIAELMNYDGSFAKSSQMGLTVQESSGEEKILAILSELKATDYISGTGAGSQRFVRNESFEKAGINLIWQSFNPPVYQQLYKTFIPNLSIIDILFNLGPLTKDAILQNHAI